MALDVVFRDQWGRVLATLAYQRALELARTEPERRFLAGRLAELTSSG